ncbi:MAG: 23S rRNA (adenine(2503)-C(2))-methyltransferase RlmN [Gemmatimonadetes bacterium]|nr:23S rRNA (adenine(2503)-C(2))-methyltransferase RlmN [Gemmatimonadota bacterium]
MSDAENIASEPGERVDLKGLLPGELREFVMQMGQENYRAQQLQSWIFGKGVASLDEMTNLSRKFREELKEIAWVSELQKLMCRESDTGQAHKFLFQLPGGERIESVLIVEGKRRTACLSSQVGCALDCSFCATGRMGFVRNLSAAQIVDQLLQVDRVLQERGERVTNVVMMGMGEPLLNYNNLVQAIQLMGLEAGPGIGGRRITVSTAGYLPGIRKLAREELNIGLAISLNATTDELRERLMPINRKYKIADLLEAAQEFYELRGRRVTFEYVLMAGVTDADHDALQLAALSRGLPCKINLIPYNELGLQTAYRRPSQRRLSRFVEILEAHTSVAVTVRESRGRDIDAACGQLFLQQGNRKINKLAAAQI